MFLKQSNRARIAVDLVKTWAVKAVNRNVFGAFEVYLVHVMLLNSAQSFGSSLLTMHIHLWGSFLSCMTR